MPRNKFPEQTRQKILDASLELFLEKGYENTTVLDIVDNMDGLTRGAFYHHFKSKEEVLDEIAGRFFYDNNPFDKVQDEEDLTGLQKLQKAIFSNAEIQVEVDDNFKEVMAVTVDLLRNPHFLMRQFEFNRKIAQNYIEPLIEEGIADGSIAPNNAKWLAELLMITMNIWTNPNISPGSVEEQAEKLELMQRLFDGVGFPVFHEGADEAAQMLFDQYYDGADFEKVVEKIEQERLQKENY
ncbi:MAG: TetR/AcrR family transcriptional regulator [Coriobacteriia bacterium]|nr:TetR/AcrR family transcriptional regulator [Coriobacteriia bacterium]MCL2746372.1 TetR/AcrR family transcriptional regulator [Coriobacteriia bacterium]MCL2870800.1 TetR/AcrR family transcriptional regulator [Coriobacteriia bacterium]